jgi:hypothetical protein
VPKRVITRTTLPRIMRELDRWEGKLTWPLFCTRVASLLGVPSISRHTLYFYPAIREGFRRRQREMRDPSLGLPRDFTVEFAVRRIADLESQVRRLEETNGLLLDQFRRWQYNAYANNLSMMKLNWDKPLPEIDRSGRKRGR